MQQESSNKQKGGRPKKAITKNIRAAVRFSATEYFIIKEKAKFAGLRPSEFLRQTAIQAKVIPRITKEDLQLLRQLAGLSTNINQVAKACHKEGLFQAMRYFEQYQSAIDAIIKQLKR